MPPRRKTSSSPSPSPALTAEKDRRLSRRSSSSPRLPKETHDKNDDDDDDESEEEDIQPTMEKKGVRRFPSSSSPNNTNTKRQKMSTMTNAYEETNLVKTEFVQQFKAQSKRATRAEEENVDLRMRLAESELKRVSTEAKVLAMMPESSARGGAKTKEEEEEEQQRRGKKRRSASPMVSPRRRSTRATSVDK